MRWISAVLLCGFMAMVMAFASQSPPALAMQVVPPQPSELARAFCPAEAPPEPHPDLWAADDPGDERVIFAPILEDAGSVQVRDIVDPYPTPAALGSGKLVMTVVTLPANTCILGSYYYPSMVTTMMSGNISILIEHWPGWADAPKATLIRGGNAFPEAFPIGSPAPLTSGLPDDDSDGDWLKIENESFVGFRNETNEPATFIVAGIKPAGDPGGGGGHRGVP